MTYKFKASVVCEKCKGMQEALAHTKKEAETFIEQMLGGDEAARWVHENKPRDDKGRLVEPQWVCACKGSHPPRKTSIVPGNFK